MIARFENIKYHLVQQIVTTALPPNGCQYGSLREGLNGSLVAEGNLNGHLVNIQVDGKQGVVPSCHVEQ